MYLGGYVRNITEGGFFFLLDFCFEVFCGDPALDNYCSEGGDVLVCSVVV